MKDIACYFDAFLRFDLPNARFLNFLKNSALFLIRPFLIIGYCVYVVTLHCKKTTKRGEGAQNRQF